MYRSPPHGHGSAPRPRPYVDPYVEVASDDLSVVSPWSMEGDVQKLLYNGEGASFMEVCVRGGLGGDGSVISIQPCGHGLFSLVCYSLSRDG